MLVESNRDGSRSGREVDPLAFTEPERASGDASPSRLIAAMTFLDGVASHGSGARVRAWWYEDVLPLGCIVGGSYLREAGHAPIALDALEADPIALQSLLSEARRKVVVALEAALRDPRSLSDVLVQTGLLKIAPAGGWTPSVGAERGLSELVLALIVSDMLDRPRLYRARFALCRRCERISFQRALTGRRGCLDHPAPSRAATERTGRTRRTRRG